MDSDRRNTPGDSAEGEDGVEKNVPPAAARDAREDDPKGARLEGGLRLAGAARASSPARPLVSVVTVALNSEACLEDAVKSVLAQSYDNIEYILVDGGSTDRTLDIVRRYENRIDYWVSEPDRGIYDAMNKGISLCSGDVIGLLNSDDQYLPGAVEDVARAYARRTTENIFIAGKWEILLGSRSSGTVVSPSFRLPNVGFCHQAIFVPRSVYDAVGLYDTRYRVGADMEMVVRLLLKGYGYVLVDRSLVRYRSGGNSWRNTRSLVRDQADIVRRNLPFSHYLRFRAYRLKSDVLRGSYDAAMRVIGEKRATGLANFYFRLKERWSRRAGGRPGGAPPG